MTTPIARSGLLAVCLLAATSSFSVRAQTIYRIVNPDGSVTMTDRPPADTTKATAVTSKGRPVATSNAAVPFELRQVMQRFPVTIYTGKDCAPCASGRALLQSRGIPYNELTVSTNEDVEALQRISGDKSLPLLTIGGQKIKGFSDVEWTQFLNAANYPARSLLTANYRHAEPRPLVALQKPTDAAPGAPNRGDATAREEAAAATPETPSVTPPITNPGGIRF